MEKTNKKYIYRKFEYVVTKSSVAVLLNNDIDRLLNDNGKRGWRFAGCMPTGSEVLIIWEKEYTTDEKEESHK